MAESNLIAQLQRNYEQLRIRKDTLKDLQLTFAEECASHPEHARVSEMLTDAKLRMKEIKEATKLESDVWGDIESEKEEIAVAKDVISGIITALIENGSMKNGEEFNLGGFTVMPKIRATLVSDKQMKMPL